MSTSVQEPARSKANSEGGEKRGEQGRQPDTLTPRMGEKKSPSDKETERIASSERDRRDRVDR